MAAVGTRIRQSSRRLAIVGKVLCVVAGVALLPGCRPPGPPAPLAFSGPTMGTQYTVKVAELPPGTDQDELASAVHQQLEQINQRMSTYLPDSELSRFNRHADDSWLPVSQQTAEVVQAALEISRRSGGAFDVTVGPLVNLWNFGPDPRGDRVPSDQEIQQQRARVGYQRLEVRLDPPALRKTHPDVYVDLSAIAKGYATDAVAELLLARGIRGFMVEVGGEVRAGGVKADGTPWRIGIEQPLDLSRALHQVVILPDRALATSGDYRNYYQIDGRRYSHAIDPRTGRPVANNLASVSVIAERCMQADGWATALMVAGPDRALQLAEENGLEVLLIVRGKQGFEDRMSPGFRRFLLSGGEGT